MELNQFLTENVLKECWHDWDSLTPSVCKICGVCSTSKYNKNNLPATLKRDFSTPADWWYLWEFCKKQEWWEEFLDKVLHSDYRMFHVELIASKTISGDWYYVDLFDLKTFPEAIARYFGWKKE